MSFPKKQIPQYPRRHWQGVGRAGSGKSTFAMRLRGPILPIDADHRIDQVAYLNSDLLELSTLATDHNDTDRIAQLLNENMPGARVGTIVVDSLTAIIAPLVTQAMADKDHGRVKNLWAAFAPKAQAMRQLQDVVTKWGCDTFWIFHLDDTVNEDREKIVKETISKTELARLMRSVNLKLEFVVKDGTRGVYVKWARRGRWGDKVGVLWDESGTWLGMPERIEAAVYDGLTLEQQAALETSLPETFPDDATAIGWGLEFSLRQGEGQRVFNELTHARNAYEKLMRDNGEPTDMQEKSDLWIGNVLARLEEQKGARGQGTLNAVADAALRRAAEHLPARSESGAAPVSAPITSDEFWKRAIALGMRGTAQPFIKANTVDGRTDWAGALRDLEMKAQAMNAATPVGAGR